MKEQIKTTILVILVIILVSLGIIYQHESKLNEYTVQITYCDNSIIVTKILYHKEPSTLDIMTYREPMPVFWTKHKKWINVCDIKVLK